VRRGGRRFRLDDRRLRHWTGRVDQEVTMSKTGRKRRGRKKKSANHGKRPNA
jgi:hypothetical protein